MGPSSFHHAARAVLVVFAAIIVSACDHHCGLGERDRVTAAGSVPCCGAATFTDVTLKGATSDAEFSLSNTQFLGASGGDAYLVPTSCGKLFDGTYPGAAPLCTIYLGPAHPGQSTGHVKLAAGSYRIFIQGASNAVESAQYLTDVYVWDYSCRPILQ